MAWSADVREQLRSGRESKEWMARVRVSGREVVLFTRQLAALVEAGVPLVKALDSLSKQAESAAFAEVLWTVHDTVTAGAYLSQAAAQFPQVFAPLYIRMLRVGETTGALVASLRKLADWQERTVEVQRRVQSALVYPAFVLGLGASITLGIFLFILPPFLEVLEGMKVELPWVTKLMALLVRCVVSPGFWLASASGLALLVLHVGSLRAEDKRAQACWDLLLRIPGLGRVLQLSTLARYTFSLSTLLDAGCDVITTWSLAAESSGNPSIIADRARLLERINGGVSVSAAMAEKKEVYTATLVQFSRGGEETARVPKMLGSLRHIFESEVDLAVDRFTVLLEPLLVALVACLTGLCMISIFLPLYSFLSKL